MSQVQIINAGTPIKVTSASNKIIIPSSTTHATSSGGIIVSHHDSSTTKLQPLAGSSTIADDQSMYRSPLKKRPYRVSTQELTDESSKHQRLDHETELSVEQHPHVIVVDASTVGGQHSEFQTVNMADVASTVYDAYLETVQFTFNNTMSMRHNLFDKLVAPTRQTTLDENQAMACWKAYESRFNEAITDVVNFAKRIPGFAALETDDQIILIKGGSFEVM